jgi:hypothetical protein
VVQSYLADRRRDARRSSTTALATYENFQRCISLPENMVKEAYDVELALRFVLLRAIATTELPRFGTAIGEYLTDKMIKLASSKQFATKKEEKVFKGTFDLLANALDGDSFRKYDSAKDRFMGGFSVAAYEVIALGVGADFAKSKTKSPTDISKLVKTRVWSDKTFLTSTGLSAASRLQTTLARGRSVFGK